MKIHPPLSRIIRIGIFASHSRSEWDWYRSGEVFLDSHTHTHPCTVHLPTSIVGFLLFSCRYIIIQVPWMLWDKCVNQPPLSLKKWAYGNSKSPRPRGCSTPLPNGHSFMAVINGGDPNYLLNGMIRQAPQKPNEVRSKGTILWELCSIHQHRFWDVFFFFGLGCTQWWANEQWMNIFPTKWPANEQQGGGWAPTSFSAKKACAFFSMLPGGNCVHFSGALIQN